MDTRPSIFSSSLRAFCVTIFVMAGITVGLVIMMLGLSSVSSNTSDVSSTYTFKALPDAEGNLNTLATSSTPVILRVDLQGVIGMDRLTTDKVRTLLAESRRGTFQDSRVKGLLLYIDSPGGTITDAEGIFQVIREYKERYKIPVYTYTQGLCASGGIYVAAVSDKILADNTALVGSVGAIMSPFLNLTQLMDKIGVQALTLSAGKDKDEMNPLRPWTKNEGEGYQQILDYYYQNFVDLIVAHRPISREKLINEYGARIFPAKIAKEHGYVDEAGVTMDEALRQIVKAAGLEGQSYQVMHAEAKSWVSDLFSAKNGFLSGTVTHKLELPAEYDPSFRGKCLYFYRD